MKPLALGLALLLASVAAGCSDEAAREAGRRVEQSIGERFEAWRKGIDDETKAKARSKAEAKKETRANEATRAEAKARAEDEVAIRRAVSVPKAYALDAQAMAAIVSTARQQRAQALTVKLSGKTVLAKQWGPQDELHAMMQMTYPIVALTMGQLVEEGHIASLDAPLGDWLPTFREGKKARITIRHVMTGRDGLASPEPFPAGLYRQADFIGFYTGAAVPYTPGEGQVLPRESVVLLGAVVQAATGMPVDRWVETRLFEPLGIRKSRWRKDKAGNVDVWAGLWLPPAGALKIGELMLNEGRWNGRQVLPRDWVVEATTPAARWLADNHPEEHGYGWRVGRRWLKYDTFPSMRQVADRRFGIQASDYVGNHLIVNPTKQLVALHTVPWDGRPVTRSIIDFEYDGLAEQLDAAVR